MTKSEKVAQPLLEEVNIASLSKLSPLLLGDPQKQNEIKHATFHLAILSGKSITKLVNCFDKDLEKGQHCGRSPCPPENCRSRILVYESKCRVCKPVSSQAEEADNQSSKNSTPREGIYIGETSRSLHERSIEHVSDAESFSAKSHIVKHK